MESGRFKVNLLWRFHTHVLENVKIRKLDGTSRPHQISSDVFEKSHDICRL